MAPAASLRVGLAAIARLRYRIHIRLGGIHRGVHIGKLALHELELADRLTELLSLVHVRHHRVHAGLHDSQRSSREHRALVIETAHQHTHTVIDAAQHVVLRNLAVGEHQFAGVRPAHAELVEFLCGGKSGKTLLDQKGGDALRPRLRIGLRVDHQNIGVRPIGDPHLRTVQHVAVAALLRPGTHADDIGTGTRLAHRQCPDVFAADQPWQVASASAPRCRCDGSG